MYKILFLKGGLGNQLFQFHRAYLDCSDKDKLILLGSLFDQYTPRRSFELKFLISDNIIFKNYKILSLPFFKYFLHFLANSRVITSDKGFGLFKYIYFGYFQDIIYFKSFNSNLKLKVIYDRLTNYVNLNPLEFKDLNTGLVYHLRLSDRVNSDSLSSFVDYLTINNFQERKIFIFTDSPELIKPLMCSFNVRFSSELNLTLLEEFYLLSYLDNVIISSSSLSVFARLLSFKDIDFLPSKVKVGDKILISNFS
jgi:hypothetical protein